MRRHARQFGAKGKPPLSGFDASDLASYLKHLPREPYRAIEAAQAQYREDQQRRTCKSRPSRWTAWHAPFDIGQAHCSEDQSSRAGHVGGEQQGEARIVIACVRRASHCLPAGYVANSTKSNFKRTAASGAGKSPEPLRRSPNKEEAPDQGEKVNQCEQGEAGHGRGRASSTLVAVSAATRGGLNEHRTRCMPVTFSDELEGGDIVGALDPGQYVAGPSPYEPVRPP